MVEFKLPELGEDIETADVINVYVKKGDKVEKDDPIVELETDKAALDLPSPVSGKIAEVMVSEGDTVKIGEVVVKIDDSGSGEESEAAGEDSEDDRKEEVKEDEAAEAKSGEEEKKGKEHGTEEKQKESKEEKTEPEEKTKANKKTEEEPSEKQDKKQEEIPLKDKDLVPASPSIRKLARELGIDINNVKGTGPGGRITDGDIKSHARDIIESDDRKPRETVGEKGYELPDFSRWGDIEKVGMSTVRRLTAENLTKAWTMPHVTQFDKADITELDKIRKQYKQKAAEAGGNLTITPIIIKVVASALRVFPKFNCSIDPVNNEIIYKNYINVGFAVDTDRGLLVPNVRNTDGKNIVDISVELADMSERARSKKLKPEEMQGGTFSVSNLGGIGGTYFTPIIYFPEVAILGVSKSYAEPVYVNGELKQRLMMPLSLSYDHRIIDGAEGIRFLRWVVEALEQPFKIIFEGEN